MRHYGIVAFLSCCSVLGGCSASEPQPPPGPGEDTAHALTIHTGEFEVPAGDSFECFYTDTMTDKELSVVSATAVAHPVAVRYAWDRWPAGCNLFNADGLPAAPFRADVPSRP